MERCGACIRRDVIPSPRAECTPFNRGCGQRFRGGIKKHSVQAESEFFFTITLPLSIPGVITGTVLAFARCLGEFGATITFVSNIPGETSTLPPLALYTLTQTPDTEGAALRLCLISIALALAAIAGSEYFSRRVGRKLRGEYA